MPAIVLGPNDAPRLVAKIKVDSETLLKARLGLKPNEPLPPGVAGLVEQATREAISQSVEDVARASVETAVKGQLKAPSYALFDDRIKTALTSAEHIGQSQDVAAILKQKAELLWAKRKAYRDAGFSDAEAMEILLAEVGTRAKA